jgi:hypothetical protein
VDVVAMVGAREPARIARAVGIPAVDELGGAQLTGHGGELADEVGAAARAGAAADLAVDVGDPPARAAVLDLEVDRVAARTGAVAVALAWSWPAP